MNTPEDPRIWAGIRSHLDELGSVATVPPFRSVLVRPRSGRPFRAFAGLATAGALVLAVGVLLPRFLPVNTPIVGVTPTATSAPATEVATPTAAPVLLTELIGHSYVAIEVTEHGKSLAIVPETRLELEFSDVSHFGAWAGCNGITGDYRIQDRRLATGRVGIGAKLCRAPFGEQENWYYMFLKSSPTISREGTSLVLTSGETVVTYVED